MTDHVIAGYDVPGSNTTYPVSIYITLNSFPGKVTYSLLLDNAIRTSVRHEHEQEHSEQKLSQTRPN